MDKADSIERKCPKGKRRKYLDYEKYCEDYFELEKSQNGLNLNWNGQIFAPNEFCLVSEKVAEICKISKSQEQLRFEFYPYLLMVSCFFLFLTLGTINKPRGNFF